MEQESTIPQYISPTISPKEILSPEAFSHLEPPSEECGEEEEESVPQVSVKAIRVKIKKSCAPKKPEKEHTKTVSKTVTLTKAKTVTVSTTLKETIDHPPETIVQKVTLGPETIINEVTKTLDPETIVKEVAVDYPVTVFKTIIEPKTVLSTVIKEPIKSTARKSKTKSSKAITVSTTVILDDDDEEGEDVECEQECSCEQDVCENPCDRIKCVVIEN
uniref:60S ribosomal protein L5 n=1 Tax=Nosema pernyi TaxID=1112939 RepID=X5E6D0_9MICR|nr:60S ribosomal protein L5 [Nosema pernyi]